MVLKWSIWIEKIVLSVFRNREVVLSSEVNWRASEASETLSGLFNRESYIYYILEKWFPLWGERASS